MPKNIVLCADGTGNLGGITPDSNVFKMYHAIDIHHMQQEQVTFYDNGVGTAANKYWRGFSGAFGFGFKQNVCDLYRFLAKQYDPGDHVFLFGFSRGAAEVRAFSGFIAAVGLVDGRRLDEHTLRDRVEEAFTTYKSCNTSSIVGEHGVVPITCIGVWDTVSALGFPQDWKVTGLGLWVLNALFMVLDRLFDVIFPHRFYNYELTPNVQFAYHALAIDDERQSFTPLIWDERKGGPEIHVEQVWFAGSHSNVGGGYARAGLANVALEWMMSRVTSLGLVLKQGVQEQVQQDANVHGRLYDSRDGLSVYYRYAPRDIQTLSHQKLRDPIQIHQSVMKRIEEQTANYAPGNLPTNFDVVGGESKVQIANSRASVEHKAIHTWVMCRQWLYGLFLEFSLLVMGSTVYFWVYPPQYQDIVERAGILGIFDRLRGHVAEVLLYILPKMFKGLVNLVVVQYPTIFWLTVLLLLGMWWLRGYFRHQLVLASEMARETLLKTLPK